MKYFELLNTACQNEGLQFDEDKYKMFMLYKDLLKEWNEKINLTAIIEDEEIITKHFIDCIKAFEFLPLKEAKNIIDIGTGAGFPGIPIKIMKPDMKVVLLDSLKKRVTYLQEVCCQLKLQNIEQIHGRAEDFGKLPEYRERFDITISRAVANLTVLSELCIPFTKIGGYFVSLKGPSVDDEIRTSKNAINILGGKLEDVIKINIEGTDLKHNLVIIKKVKSTPKQYPRKAGTAAKKPLV